MAPKELVNSAALRCTPSEDNERCWRDIRARPCFHTAFIARLQSSLFFDAAVVTAPLDGAMV